jgi:hypothetical protein
MLPLVEPLSESSANGSITIKMGKKPGERILTYRSSNKSEMVIHQTWIEGEPWWREFERYRDGKLELRAKLVPKPAPDPPLTVPVVPQIATGNSQATVVDESDNVLLKDPRLQKLVTIKLVHPRVQDILDRCNTAAGLTLTADEDVDAASPVFSAVNWVDIPVWSVMTRLAEAPSIKGQWEQDAEGYRLTSSLRKPADLTKTTTGMRIFLTTLGIVAIVSVGSVLVLLRWRKKKTASTKP